MSTNPELFMPENGKNFREYINRDLVIYILWLASMIVNNNTDTAPNKSIALVVFVVAIAAATTIIILLLSHRIDCIPSSTAASVYLWDYRVR